MARQLLILLALWHRVLYKITTKRSGMTTTVEEAAQALREIDLIRHRAAGFQDYQAESGQLLLWGLAYVVGFALTACFRDHLLLVWTVVVLSAVSIGVRLAR